MRQDLKSEQSISPSRDEENKSALGGDQGGHGDDGKEYMMQSRYKPRNPSDNGIGGMPKYEYPAHIYAT